MINRFLVFLTLSIIGVSSKAQISITEYDMPGTGSVFLYKNSTDLLSEDFSTTGANHSWDFSSGTENNRDTIEMVDVSSTPFAYQFYFNNQWTQPNHFSDYAQAGQDLDLFGQVTVENRFDFFAVNSNSLEIKGYGAEINGVPASVKYDTIDQIYPFPMYDGMPTHYSSGYYLASVPNLGTYGQWIRRTVEVDGYGSLITPDGNYPNTLRVKTVLFQRDTVYVDQFMIGQAFERPEEIIYEWFTNEDKTPVMKVVVRGSQNTEVKYLSGIAASIEEEKLSEISIKPTNSKGVFMITNPNSKLFEVTVLNIKGQNVMNLYNPEVINLSSKSDGVYLLKIKEKTGKINCIKVVK